MLDVGVSRVLYFDRFSLDLARGCLRMGDKDLELRPKAFEVLKYLAMNAGRLVAKQELYDAVRIAPCQPARLQGLQLMSGHDRATHRGIHDGLAGERERSFRRRRLAATRHHLQADRDGKIRDYGRTNV